MWKPEYAEKPFSGIAVTQATITVIEERVKYDEWPIWYAGEIQGFIMLPEDTAKTTMPATIEINGTRYIRER